MKYLKFYSGKAVKPSALSSIIHFKLQKKPQNTRSLFIEFRVEKLSQKVSKFSKFTKVSPRQSFSTLFMFLVSESKWTQKLVFIAFSTCKQNLRASLIWGKELEVFLFLFICHFMICVNVPLGIFKDDGHRFHHQILYIIFNKDMGWLQ